MPIRTGVGLLVAGGVLLATIVSGQQVQQTRAAKLRADRAEFALDSDTIEFMGNCKVTISGASTAEMTTPAMTFTLAKKDKSWIVKTLVAQGPVGFTVITRPDASGARRKVVGSAKERAVYSEETQLIKLQGEAQADMVPLDAADSQEALHFTGQTIVFNLKTGRMTMENADVTVKTQVQ
jgi:lipopolysaccharide export system protein LptA